jgi:hypothetical protein
MPGSRCTHGPRKDSRALPLATRSASPRGFTEPVATSSKSTHGPTDGIRSRVCLRRDHRTDRTRWVSIALPCARSTGTACASDRLKPSTARRSSTSSGRSERGDPRRVASRQAVDVLVHRTPRARYQLVPSRGLTHRTATCSMNAECRLGTEPIERESAHQDQPRKVWGRVTGDLAPPGAVGWGSSTVAGHAA